MGDTLTPPAPALAQFTPLPSPVSVINLEGTHFDAYETGFEASCSAAVAFFTEHLQP